MGDYFLKLLTNEFKETPEKLPSNTLICAPQARSLISNEEITIEMLYSHLLVPPSQDMDRPIGEYYTLNGKSIQVRGSYIYTIKGYKEQRKVRILFSESKVIFSQKFTIFHLSRPLIGGMTVPDDMNEMDMKTYQRYLAILRSFPENEIIFHQLDETIAQVCKICVRNQLQGRYESKLPEILLREWEKAVQELINLGSLENLSENDQEVVDMSDHILVLEQVVESYFMENLHSVIFPHLLQMHAEDQKRWNQVLQHMIYHGPADFGIPREFHCDVVDIGMQLVNVAKQDTPLDMLLILKSCLDTFNDRIMKNFKRHHVKLGKIDLTTDDILDQLLYILIETYKLSQMTHDISDNATADGNAHVWESVTTDRFPILAVMDYISRYHFTNSNSTALGFTFANFQVAVNYFQLRVDHFKHCNKCSMNDLNTIETITCKDTIVKSIYEQVYEKCVEEINQAKLVETETIPEIDSYALQCKQLSVLGDWSVDKNEIEHEEDEFVEVCSSIIQFDLPDAVIDISVGDRFFAAVTEDGALYTWGDSTGGRLGYAPLQGEGRRVASPRRVERIIKEKFITHVACGGFHALAIDVNGHCFAWGQNGWGQLGFITSSTSDYVVSSTPTVDTPTLVTGLKGHYISSIACGSSHSMALSSEGKVFTWGSNQYSQLGRSCSSHVEAAKPCALDHWQTSQSVDLRDGYTKYIRVRRIAAGTDHSLALTDTGIAFAWGRGDDGQLGQPSTFADSNTPQEILRPLSMSSNNHSYFRKENPIVQLDGGKRYSLLLLKSGHVLICGKNPNIPKNLELTTEESKDNERSIRMLKVNSLVHGDPDSIDSVVRIHAIACGDHFCLQQSNGTVLLSQTNSISPLVEVQLTKDDGKQLALFAHRIACGASHALVVS